MESNAVNNYIKKRYNRWLDYAKYHCSLAGISDEATDILNEVLCMLLEKPKHTVLHLLNSPHDKYTELDFYVLKMIKLNVTSPTSPYQHKYKPIPQDDNVDWQHLNIVDEAEEDEEDKSSYIRNRIQEIRDTLSELNLSEKAVKIFTWKFFAGESFSNWPGPEGRKELYTVYKRVFKAILDKMAGNILF